MKNKNEGVWVGLDDKNNDPEFAELVKQEFVELPIIENLGEDKSLQLQANRRDFLKFLGFGVGAATLAAGCDIPVKRAIPYVTKPDAIVPGVANYYASSFVKGGDYCSVLVKTREGRPIKIEGNSLSKITRGGTSARAQAAVLSLYDTNRLAAPCTLVDGAAGEKLSWKDFDAAVKGKLNGTSRIAILTNTVMSPTAKQAIQSFKSAYSNAYHVAYDPISSSAILEANQESFGRKAIPDYHFDKANVIVSFGADFLGTWISPVEYANKYAETRKIKDPKNPSMSLHVQIESGMSMTGSNADNRILIKPSEQGSAIVALYNALGGSGAGNVPLNDRANTKITALAGELKKARGNSIVVAGSNNIGEQLIVNKINDMLGNYGSTIDFNAASYQRQGIDSEIQNLIAEMGRGTVDAVMVWDANPAFDLPNSGDFAAAFAKVGTKVFMGESLNETGALCDMVAPTHHFLESWGDVEAKAGHFSLIQPTIAPLFDTRQAEETLLALAGTNDYNPSAEQPYFDYLKKYWQNNLFNRQNRFGSFQSFWENVLHDGVFVAPQRYEGELACSVAVGAAFAKINKPENTELEISLFESITIGAGQYANNPWLQELPDPVTRTVWGNYLSVPIGWDGDNNYVAYKGIGYDNKKSKGDFVNVSANGSEAIKLTAAPQFGQAEGTVSMALGYGRKVIGKSGMGIGHNINPWMSLDANGNTKYYATDVSVSDIVGVDKEYPCVQYHHTMGVTGEYEGEKINVDEQILGHRGYQGSLTKRSIIRQSHVNDLSAFVGDLAHEREHHQFLNSKSIYKGHDEMYSIGHHWGMHIDLNACIGCGACSVACMAENNVPVVGKREVHRHHEMSWLRIDRYYYGDVENPNTVYQPLMCQHCDNAPCENVCPVAATNHSAEGLNQMTYNRCIGTRYCANNCPYKVRRFNWLDYTTADLFPANEPKMNPNEDLPFGADNLTRMVLNPDVTVRSRGVIEKCSFCVQRIQEGKLTAKAEGRQLTDSDVKTACQTSCPTGAIVFGDQNNEKGELAKKLDNPLNYILLEEINVRSSVTYTAKVHNRSESIDA